MSVIPGRLVTIGLVPLGEVHNDPKNLWDSKGLDSVQEGLHLKLMEDIHGRR